MEQQSLSYFEHLSFSSDFFTTRFLPVLTLESYAIYELVSEFLAVSRAFLDAVNASYRAKTVSCATCVVNNKLRNSFYGNNF